MKKSRKSINTLEIAEVFKKTFPPLARDPKKPDGLRTDLVDFGEALSKAYRNMYTHVDCTAKTILTCVYRY